MGILRLLSYWSLSYVSFFVMAVLQWCCRSALNKREPLAFVRDVVCRLSFGYYCRCYSCNVVCRALVPWHSMVSSDLPFCFETNMRPSIVTKTRDKRIQTPRSQFFVPCLFSSEPSVMLSQSFYKISALANVGSVVITQRYQHVSIPRIISRKVYVSWTERVIPYIDSWYITRLPIYHAHLLYLSYHKEKFYT